MQSESGELIVDVTRPLHSKPFGRHFEGYGMFRQLTCFAIEFGLISGEANVPALLHSPVWPKERPTAVLP